MNTPKQAIIFAAGLGTRLKPITNSVPKVLVKVGGIPMLERIILKLISNSFKKIVVNTHYFAQQIKEFIDSQNFDAEIIISYEKEILETGGGLVFAKKYFSKGNILIYNGDILTDINIDELWKQHNNNGAIATLSSFSRKSSREFLWNIKDVLSGWRNIETKEYKWSRKSEKYYGQPFAAIHVVSTKIFDYLPSKGKFSLTPAYLEIAKTKVIKKWESKNSYWFDIGSLAKLEEANKFFGDKFV